VEKSSGAGGVGPVSSGWTVDTAVAHLLAVIALNDRRYEERFAQAQIALKAALDAQEKAVAAALASADRAVTKAEEASTNRFDAVNEFRATLADQQRTLMPRAEAEVILKGFADRLAVSERRESVNQGV